MTAVVSRSIALAAVSFLLAAAAVLGAPVAVATSARSCSASKNVVLGVDFGSFGGPVVRACDPVPANGLALLNENGFRSTGTTHDGPAFVCRIASDSFAGGAAYPTPAQDACHNTPPASAYWSYWHADAGQNTWSYSKLGAASTHPKAGSVDFWRFGGTDVSGSRGQPSVTPNAVRAAGGSNGSGGSGGSGSGNGGNGSGAGASNNGSTQSTHRRSGSGGNGGSGNGATRNSTTHNTVTSGAHNSGLATTRASGSASSTSRPTRPSSSSANGPTSAAADASTGPSGSSSSQPNIINGSPAAHSRESTSSSGSAVPLIVGLMVVLVIGGGAGWTVLRRRATDAG